MFKAYAIKATMGEIEGWIAEYGEDFDGKDYVVLVEFDELKKAKWFRTVQVALETADYFNELDCEDEVEFEVCMIGAVDCSELAVGILKYKIEQMEENDD